MFWTLVIGAVLLTITYFYLKYKKGKNYWEKRGVKQLKFNQKWYRAIFQRKSVVEIDQDLVNVQLKNEKYGGFSFMNTNMLFVKDLDILRLIMVKDFDLFPSRTFNGKSDSGKYTSKMLSISEGQEWKMLRTTMSPLFTTGKIKRMFQIFDKCGENFGEYLDRISGGYSTREIDLQNSIQKYTLSVIASSVFGVDANLFNTEKDEETKFHSMAKTMFKINVKFILRAMTASIFPFIAKIFKLGIFDQTCVNYFANIIKDSIQKREKNKSEDLIWNDFLQLMLDQKKLAKNKKVAESEQEEILDDFERDAKLTNFKAKMELNEDHIIAQCILFFFAGYDPTESLMTWAFYELSINPEIQNKLRTEIENSIEKNGGNLTYDSLLSIEYLDNFISETLRKYPPAPRGDRKCEQNYLVKETGLEIEKNTYIIIPIYSIHHDPTIWPNPEEFNPDRFKKEEKEKRHPYAWMPFGNGPRNCIGMRFALTESKVVIAHMLRKFTLEFNNENGPAEFDEKSPFLKPKNPIKLILKPREKIIS